MEAPVIYLDTLPLGHAEVGYGTLGLQGHLGYEAKQVTVHGHPYVHALSTHPPARLGFTLDGRFASFTCQVALNDDVQAGVSHADFTVLADGQHVATAPYVVAGEPPRRLQAAIAGAQHLELVVRTSRWAYCHAVWLDPQVSGGTPEVPAGTLRDCLGRTAITLPSTLPRAQRCLATIVSPGFEGLLDDLLGSFYAHSHCQDALVVVFGVDVTPACEQVIAKYQATLVRCTAIARVNATVKAVLYSVARVVDAEQFLCLDADMLVLGDLRPLFAALEACPEGSILACREGNGRGWHGFENLGHALRTVYGGHEADLGRLVDIPADEGSYPLVVNDGLFAGSRTALLALDGMIRAMPAAAKWTDERRDISWRNQFLFNLVLARLRCGVELDPTYNVQLNSQDVQLSYDGGRMKALWYGQSARVLHFNGLGRHKNAAWRNLFARVPDPWVGPGGSNPYETFLSAVQAWVGRYGLQGLAESLYGPAAPLSAHVSAPSMMPLLAVLHYLIRAQGYMQVLEIGTAYGVTTACLAAAVAHWPSGRIVTFDPVVPPERTALWASLPEAMQACLELRQGDALEGMKAACEAGERYDAALLHVLPATDHSWVMFQLALQLVSPGGLLLVCMGCWKPGTGEQVLQRIAAGGYRVVHLGTVDVDRPDEASLGLVVIENRSPSAGPTPMDSKGMELG